MHVTEETGTVFVDVGIGFGLHGGAAVDWPASRSFSMQARPTEMAIGLGRMVSTTSPSRESALESH